ncbi:MAG TPA: hypothetical protein VFA21_22305 [Pyrinomonadaceae bacterium]|nr:hypothetical protein [Pyrinomonadaceae bacterium]
MGKKLTSFIAFFVALMMCLGPAASYCAAQTPAPALQHYTMIDLTPAGATTATASGANGAQQVGSAAFPVPASPGQTETHAVLWQGGADAFTDLGPGTAYAVGDGQQVGVAFGHAALWSGTPGSLVDLNPNTWDSSVASGVASGQQVGSATVTRPCGEKRGACGSGSTSIHPFLWTGSASSAVDLTPSALGYGAGQALGTDGAHQVGVVMQVVGISAFTNPAAVLWSGTAASAVILNPPGSTESRANAVSGNQQVGYAYSVHQAMLWSGSAASAVNLHPAGYLISEAKATNGVRQAGYGTVYNAAAQTSHTHALVWSGDAASAVDLNQFMPLGFTDATATGIDAAGNVVGWAVKGSANNTANVHAVMWVPSTTPLNFSQSVAASQSVIGAGDSVQATVTLNQPAPAGGALVQLAGVLTAPGAGTQPPLNFSIPPSVTVPEGETSASFDVTTSATSLAGFTHAFVLDIQAAYGDTTQTATATVTPPLSLSAFGVAPGNVTGGAAVTGTVTLSAPAPAGGALVQLSSNSAAALVPASVVVPAGQTAASFGVQTNQVAAFTNVTLTATYNGALASTRTASFLVAPPPVAVDTVAIQKADYVVSKKQLVVQASSTSQTATLTATVTATGEVIGVLTNKGAGSYAATFAWPASPQSITVTSDLSGTATRAVTLK